MEISEKIKQFRLELGLNQLQFAELLGVVVSAVSSWETARRVPRIGYMKQMVELAKKHKIKMTIKDLIY